ncbi:MAG: NUDIX domain-containing protein [Chloroflexi bacterium]|nr:NUDIX domain-containing protein [Chloroflexota bacterium]
MDGYIKWLRSHIGHELIYLVYVIAFVFDEDDHLLVQERYDFDWLSVPGGAYEPHETITQTVIRETLEETGISADVEEFIGVFSHPDYNLLYPNGDRVQPWTVAFKCRAQSASINVDGKETLKAAFQPVDTIKHRLPLQYQHALETITSNSAPFIEPIYFESESKAYYPVLRQHVGKAKIILPGCVAAIFNDNDEVLAVHKIHTDFWFLPGGLSDLGETTSGTVYRETLEETGLEIEPTRIIGLYSEPQLMYIKMKSGHELQTVDLLLECEITGGSIQPDGVEIDAVEFKSIDWLLSQPNCKPIHHQYLQDLKNRGKTPVVR